MLHLTISGTILACLAVSLYFFLQAIKKPVTIEEDHAADMESGVALYTSPTNISTVKGETLTINLDINTASESVTGADIVINYDKLHLVVNSITPGNFFPKTLKKYDDNNGTITLVFAANKGESRYGQGTVASITFTALAEGTTMVNYSNFSQVAVSEALVNVLSSSSGTTININGIPSVKSSSDNTPGSDLTIFALGTMADNQYPTMELIINGETAAIFYNVDGIQKKYTYHHPTRIEPSQVRVRFVNDYNDQQTKTDRNLKVNKIQIDGKDFESEGQDTYSIGTWNQNSCGEGFKKSEWLYCNGEFRYSL